jgi:hypothetical protein
MSNARNAYDITLITAGFFCTMFSFQLFAEPPHERDHSGLPKLSPQDEALSKKIQARLGDTSTLMGFIAIP